MATVETVEVLGVGDGSRTENPGDGLVAVVLGVLVEGLGEEKVVVVVVVEELPGCVSV